MSNRKSWKNWTISTKIGTIISIGIITSIVVIIIGTVTFLKKEYLDTFGRQQFTTLQAFATYLDADLTGKLKAITDVAVIVPLKVLADTSSSQHFLNGRMGIFSLFDDGLMLLSAEGRLMAETPFISADRIEKDYSATPFFQQADKAGQPIISEPFYSLKPGQRPIIEMVAPIHDDEGKISGYVCGGLTLNGDNALGNIARRNYGEKGYFYVYSQDRTILIHHDSSRMMKQDVPPGANRLFDLALQGFNGSGETINSRGLYFLASFQHLQAAPWILAVNLPKEEVLVPFYNTQGIIILTIIVCGTMVLVITWWGMFRFMTPLQQFITHMKECGNNAIPFQYQGNAPELTLLATIFNQMLADMQESQRALAANEELQRTLLNASPDIICFKDGEGRWLLANEADLHLFHLQGAPYQGKKDSELASYTPFFHDAFMTCEFSDEQAWNRGKLLIAEEVIHQPDQDDIILEVIKSPLFHSDGSRKALVVIGRNITERKKNEDKLRVLSKAVEQGPVSIVITDTEGTIEFVNPQFTKLTGYTFDEAIGKNPRILKTDKTPPEVFRQLWQTISNGRIWEGDLYNKKKDGEEFTEHATISPIFDDSGKITHYMAVKVDITAKKRSEEIIWRQANFDSLTNLPNRHSFTYHLENTILKSKRERSSFSLIFLDLDHFKDINDTLGHDQGDILLIEAARRILHCVRDSDIVARFGGDEFVILLANTNLDIGIRSVTEKILTSLSAPFSLQGREFRISVSIGVSLYPNDGHDSSTLLKNADLAMYYAKASGRNNWKTFQEMTSEDERQSP